uniref:Integrase catalytic domain-containing protein n=2 Tax=Trichogramma kaykai TaxID=54128 RepID=A0ABD2WDA2_9HYME
MTTSDFHRRESSVGRTRVLCLSGCEDILRGGQRSWRIRSATFRLAYLTLAGGMYERWTIQPIARQEDYRRSNWPHSHFGGMALLVFSTRKQRGQRLLCHRVRVFSSFSTMVKVLCYCRRWLAVIGQAGVAGSDGDEWREARFMCFRWIQAHHFEDDVRAVTAGEKLPKRSRLRALHPFIGTGGLLRVGGRLQNAPLTYDEKHLIILPGHCLIMRRLIEQAHRDTLHGGPQLMRSHLGRMFWILRGPLVIPAVYRECVRCARFRATAMEQQIGPLPAVRVTPGRPFQVTGLDYAGPLPILFSKGRKAPSTKGYVAIFICMVVRAVHVEVVSDLTTSAFLPAFSRFCARRGRPAVLYSDNGTTFKGASRELRELFSKSSHLLESASNRLQKRGTVWKFIPPRAPHFGGLWEAAERSFKYHFRRVIGDPRLTFEELSTEAARIEACLNSRPLCPRSSRPEDLEALTPAHFLVGSSLLDYPEPYNEQTLNFTSRWRLLRGMRNLFWSRWRREVLSQMQQRSKWLTARESLQPGDMVLLRDDLCSPSSWPLARVEQVHPGSDGLVRVATIKTASSTFTRPIVKLIKLPTDAQAEEFYCRLNEKEKSE